MKLRQFQGFTCKKKKKRKMEKSYPYNNVLYCSQNHFNQFWIHFDFSVEQNGKK